MNHEYEAVIGLEIHAELNTETKIFCGCKNLFGAPPNTLCCPVCTGMPGALPVLNERAVEYAVLMGNALNCRINPVSQFERKNYFYPDLPKAYQISQLNNPICEDGYLDILVKGQLCRIGIERIQLEEDAGKLVHNDDAGGTLADYNRSGVPLLEIVSRPDLRSGQEAKFFMESIATILLYLGISDVKMQEGSMRADVNVSVRPVGATRYGTRNEMKNVNSFSAVYRAVEYEIKRQISVIESGGEILQETRRWDDLKGVSFVMRNKADTADYLFFPEPDIPPLRLSEEMMERVKSSLPELPLAKTKRYMEEYGLQEQEALLLASEKSYAAFFDEAARLGVCQPKNLANWMLGDLLKYLNEKRVWLVGTKLKPDYLSQMVAMVEKGEISHTAGKTILGEMLEQEVSPLELMKTHGLQQNSDLSFSDTIVEQVLAESTKAVEDYKNGKTNVLGFLVGLCMKASQGKGNPALFKELLEKRLQGNG